MAQVKILKEGPSKLGVTFPYRPAYVEKIKEFKGIVGIPYFMVKNLADIFLSKRLKQYLSRQYKSECL